MLNSIFGRYKSTLLFKIAFILTLIFCSCAASKPEILSLEPKIGKTGDILSIAGENFGEAQGESFVSFGGVEPTQSSYKSWQDKLIEVRIPDFGESCLVTVYRDKKKSNALLFSTLDAMPALPVLTQNQPVITGLSGAQNGAGGILEVNGAGFGSERGGGAVFFTLNGAGETEASTEASMIKADENYNSYELWSDTLIRVLVPDGASSGRIYVETASGRSNPFVWTNPSESAQNSISKKLKDKKTYSISYAVDVKIENAELPNLLFLWLPIPISFASQKNRELLERNIEPFIDNYHGAQLFKFIDMKNSDTRKSGVSYLVDVYAVETTPRPPGRGGAASSAKNSFAEKNWTLSSALVYYNEQTRLRAEAISAGQSGAWEKSRSIYRSMLKEAASEKDVFEFCALNRSIKIPAVPIAGVLINRQMETRPHLWAAVWIDGAGFIPVDITLGRGAWRGDYYAEDDYAEYYFGNSDNKRIAFSFGEAKRSANDPNTAQSSSFFREQEYALQNIWEESSQGIKSYSSYWSDIEITGVY